jgi:hypothetical protein
MRSTLLPAARAVYLRENAQLAAADQQATAVPYAAFVVALIVAIGLFAAQRWLARRTRRIINPGLLLASLAGLMSLIWLVTACTVASVQFSSARDHGSAPVEALAKADIAALQAHADESLNLIDRGGDASIQQDFVSQQKELGPGSGTHLTEAAAMAAGSPGAAPALAATRAARPPWARPVEHDDLRRMWRRNAAACRRLPQLRRVDHQFCDGTPGWRPGYVADPVVFACSSAICLRAAATSSSLVLA